MPIVPSLIVLLSSLSLTRCAVRWAGTQFQLGQVDTKVQEIQVRSWHNEHTHEWSAEINGKINESLTHEELLELLGRAVSDLEEEARRLQ
jgi:hypothetical protein